MYEEIGRANVQLGERVTGISASTDGVQVTTSDVTIKQYYHVVSTMSLGCLQTVDLDNALLSYE